MRAAADGKLNVVHAFIQAGIEVDVADREGAMALMRAAAAGHVAVMELLLKAMASVAPPESERGSALGWAAGAGQVRAVQILLAARPSRTVTTRALGVAARSCHVPVIQVLSQAGGSMAEVGADALRHVANGRDSPECIETAELLQRQHVPVDNPTSDGQTPLMMAAHQRNVGVVRVLLKAGAQVGRACDCTGYLGGGFTALAMAIQTSQLELIDLLLEPEPT